MNCAHFIPPCRHLSKFGRYQCHCAGGQRLGRGEIEAMQLAIQIEADWLLLDDRQARATAVKLGIRCVALTGLLIKAKQLGYVRSVRELLERLEQRGGLYLSDAVKDEALRQAGE
jgi:predicted nucleic acid-binding protein